MRTPEPLRMPLTTSLDVAIVGGGVAGMTTAFWLGHHVPALRVAVFEREVEPGGKVSGISDAGHVVDWGPASFVANSPDLRALIAALGLDDEVRYGAPAARRRYLYADGRLQALPGSPPALVRSQLLPPSAKLRALAEPLVPRARGEESVFDFMARRFGRALAARFADPLVAGISAGVATEVSADALFPRLKALEREHGSLLRGALRQAAAARRNRAAPSAASVGRSSMLTLAGGTQRLSAALATTLGDRLVVGSGVRALRRAGAGFELELDRGDRVTASRVALALPAPVSAALLAQLAPAAARRLNEVVYADVMVHTLAYSVSALPSERTGFGYLVAAAEEPRSLGTVFTSTLFPEQAPAGTTLLRVLSGGRRDPDFLDLSDAAALASVQRDLRLALGITAAPRAVWSRRWRDAIPQYRLGHTNAMQAAQAELDAVGGLDLTGDVVAGLGVADCVGHARALAGRLAGAVGTSPTATTHRGDVA